MAEEENGPREGHRIEHPNREKASSKATKAVIVLLLLASVALMVIVTIGGWDALEGAKAIQIAFIVMFAFMAFMIARWNRGLLPVAGALSIILLIFAAVSGSAWFERDKDGFTSPALNESIVGLLTFVLVPVQIVLIAFVARGFAQAWNVEVERPIDEQHEDQREPQPA